MTLPARKLPGATRRRKKAARLRRVRQRLLGVRALRPLGDAPWDTAPVGEPVLKDVLRMIELLEKDKKR